jgi:hypothetical protein
MSYHFTPTGALTDASQTASIAEIKTKTDKITITSNLNLNTMETDIATNLTGVNGILNHSIDSNLKAFVDANSAKNTYPTADATKMGNISITSAVDLNELNSRFPRQNIIRRYAYTTGDIYSDEKVKFNWDGTNRQLSNWHRRVHGRRSSKMGGGPINESFELYIPKCFNLLSLFHSTAIEWGNFKYLV